MKSKLVLIGFFLFTYTAAFASDEILATYGALVGYPALKFGHPVKFWSELYSDEDCWPLQNQTSTIAWLHRYFVVKGHLFGFYCTESANEGDSGTKIPDGEKYGYRENKIGQIINENKRMVFKPIEIPGWTLQNPSIFQQYVAYWRAGKDGTHASVYDLFNGKVIRDILVGPQMPGADWATFPLPEWNRKDKKVIFPSHSEYKSASFVVE